MRPRVPPRPEDAWGFQRRGIGTRVVGYAAEEAKKAGCEWLHVDFEDHLRSFYVDACAFAPTSAGLIHLGDVGRDCS